MTQLTITLDNRPGALAKAIKLLSTKKINIAGIGGELIGVFGSIHLLVTDKSAIAKKVLEKAGYHVKLSPAIKIAMVNKPGELSKYLKKLAAKKVNIVTMYGTACDCGCDCKSNLMIIPDNIDRAKKAI
ncbi:hypothetical protein ACFL6Y_06340 [Elusimicrobiota bacterium]